VGPFPSVFGSINLAAEGDLSTLESEWDFRGVRQERLISLPSPSLELLMGLRLCVSRGFQHYFQCIYLHATYMIYIGILCNIGWYFAFAFVRPVVEIGDDFPVMVNSLTASPLQKNGSNVNFLFHFTYLGIIFLFLSYSHFQPA